MERGKRQAMASFFGGTGFYIALLLCVMVAGICGYLLLFGGQEEPEVDASANVDNVVQDVGQTPRPQVTPAPTPAEDPAPAESETASRPVTVITPEPERTPDPAPAETPPAAPDAVVVPVQGETVSAFSVDALQYSETLGDWRTHDGIDISAPAGTAVVAVCGGTVLSVAEDSRLGTTVVLSHSGGCETSYASLGEEVSVSPGDTVSAGDQIGVVGNTSLSESALGAHLHFSVTQDGQSMDPADYLAR